MRETTITTDKNNFVFPLRKPRSDRGDVGFTSCSRCFPIDTQAIRNKILDLAIRGKLTEQLPEDGSAEELYQEIQAGKTRIIAERNGRVDKSIRAVGEDIPYLIPAHWKWIRFGDVGLFKKGPFGSALTKAMFVPKSENAVKVYEQQHAIKKNPALGTYYISKDYFRDKLKGFEVKSGDILISCAGTIGETYVLPDEIEPGIINQALMRVTLVSGVDNKFFQYYFESELKNSAKAGNGSAIVNIPPFDVIKNWYFPLPSLAEQQRVVERIEQAFSVLDTIDALQAQCADNLTVLKTKLLEAAIQGKLTTQLPEDGTAEDLYRQIQAQKQALIKAGKIKKEKPLPEITAEEIPFEIPKNWKWIRLGNFCQKVTDQVASGSFAALRENVKSLKTPDYAIMVKTADFSNDFQKNLTYTDKHGYEFLGNSNLFGGELILSNVGSVGKCFIVPKLPCKMTLAPNAVMIRMVEEAGKDYLYCFLTSPQGFRELDAISTGVAVKKFNKTDLKTILIPLPPLAEQQRIVNRLNELFSFFKV